jgi:ferredoxin
VGLKVVLDAAACTGHGRCYALAPDVFAPDEQGHCELLVTDVPAGLEDQARAGVANCPEQALRLEDS